MTKPVRQRRLADDSERRKVKSGDLRPDAFFFPLALLFFCLVLPVFAQKPDGKEIENALRKSVGFYREQLAAEGGYLWKYSADLTLREGENVADARTVWVQPPGTPTIGRTFLRAFHVTGDRYYLEAAVEAGHCLVQGQLESGGWTYTIFFDPAQRKKYRYRVEGAKSSSKARNVSTLDDNTTQAALVFLMELDEALEFKDVAIHDAVRYGLEKLLEAQYPNGAFPQGFLGEKRDPSEYPVLKANFPPKGVEPTREKDYWKFYTFNDGLVRDVNHVFFVAAEIYGSERDGIVHRNEKYVEAAEKLGDFMIAAQLPEPQPGWAQQYDFNMRPCWARKFEPASVTGGESQSVINALIELYWFTGKKKYLEPIPSAIRYFENSRLADGTVARFYEMRTNKPLFMTRQYELTYSDDDLPTHYSFSVKFGSWPIEEYLKMNEGARLKRQAEFRDRYRQRSFSKVDDRETTNVIRSLDKRGAWVTKGVLKAAPGKNPQSIIDNAVFVRNVNRLLDALHATGSK